LTIMGEELAFTVKGMCLQLSFMFYVWQGSTYCMYIKNCDLTVSARVYMVEVHLHNWPIEKILMAPERRLISDLL
jgi:hypothetical protein